MKVFSFYSKYIIESVFLLLHTFRDVLWFTVPKCRLERIFVVLRNLSFASLIDISVVRERCAYVVCVVSSKYMKNQHDVVILIGYRCNVHRLRSVVKYGDQGQSGQAIKLFRRLEKLSFTFHFDTGLSSLMM